MTTRTVTGLFGSYDEAERAVRDIEASGVPHNEISIVANNSDDRYTLAGEAGPQRRRRGPKRARHLAVWSVAARDYWPASGCWRSREWGQWSRPAGSSQRLLALLLVLRQAAPQVE